MNKFMKLVKLEGFMKSEFEPTMDFYEVFQRHGLYPGRMISGGKTAPKGHVAVFNSNIVIEKHGKIWYGDINITLERDKLQAVANELCRDLYILREHDARFDKENAGIVYWKKHAVTVIKCNK